jgi:hypothetical protein
VLTVYLPPFFDTFRIDWPTASAKTVLYLALGPSLSDSYDPIRVIITPNRKIHYSIKRHLARQHFQLSSAMSPIFEVIPETKTVKRTAQVVNEPLQVIPEEEELNLEVKHVSKSEHPSRAGVMPHYRRCVGRLLPSLYLSTEHLSPPTHVCTSSVSFIHFQKTIIAKLLSIRPSVTPV